MIDRSSECDRCPHPIADQMRPLDLHSLHEAQQVLGPLLQSITIFSGQFCIDKAELVIREHMEMFCKGRNGAAPVGPGRDSWSYLQSNCGFFAQISLV